MNKRIIGWACALLCIGAAQAQTAGTISLTASPTTGQGSVTPKLTWSTSPAAASCTASGGWSGAKAASGTQTLTAIKANTNYTLTCAWGSAGSATLSWDTPTKNSDGTPLTNLASFKVLYGTSSATMNNSLTINSPTSKGTTISSLTPATWYFKVRAINSSGVESSDSNMGSKTLASASAAKTVAVTVTQASLTTKATNVWDVLRRSDGVWVRNAVVGQIALGKPCYTTFKVGEKHYLINRTDARLTATPRSTNLVVNCVG